MLSYTTAALRTALRDARAALLAFLAPAAARVRLGAACAGVLAPWEGFAHQCGRINAGDVRGASISFCTAAQRCVAPRPAAARCDTVCHVV